MNQRKASNISSVTEKKPKLIFWDFKNYWEDALVHIVTTRFPEDWNWEKEEKEKWGGKIGRKEWRVKYNSYKGVVNDKGYFINNNEYKVDILHVFIAPITWAGLYTGHFTILGPAFGTYGDIKLYNLKDKTKPSTDSPKKANGRAKKKITIGVIEELATSTIGLQIIMKGICRQTCNGRNLKMPDPEEHYDDRFDNLKKRKFTAAVFNENDIQQLSQNSSSHLINDIVDIDELYALAKSIPNLPRVVYAISKKQLDDTSLTEQKEVLITSLEKITSDMSNIVKGKIHILAPFNNPNTRKAIIEFIKDGKKAFGNVNRVDLNIFDHEVIEKNFYKLLNKTSK